MVRDSFVSSLSNCHPHERGSKFWWGKQKKIWLVLNMLSLRCIPD